MANQELHHRQLRIGHMHSSVKRCRSIKDRNRLWKVGVRDLVRDICCALHNSGFVFPLGSRRFNRDKLKCFETTHTKRYDFEEVVPVDSDSVYYRCEACGGMIETR